MNDQPRLGLSSKLLFIIFTLSENFPPSSNKSNGFPTYLTRPSSM